jgi:hypothetical protein
VRLLYPLGESVLFTVVAKDPIEVRPEDVTTFVTA